MNTKETNMEIIRLLVNVINMYPELRFGQILQATEVVRLQRDMVLSKPYLSDNFYEESEDTLERLKERIADFNSKR